MQKYIHFLYTKLHTLLILDFIPLLAIRFYLIPVLYVGARSKLLNFAATVEWLGGPMAEGGLGLPFPELMAILAILAEGGGLILLALGLATRLVSFILVIFMLVAAVSVHWVHGWLVIADKNAESTQRLNGLMEWLSANFPGRYNYVTELGDPVMLNNGLEFVVTYCIMLSVLLFFGAGKYISCDYWLGRYWKL